MSAPCSRARALVPGLLPSLLLGAWLALPGACPAEEAPAPSLFETYPSWCDEKNLDRAIGKGADVNETLANGITVLDMVLAHADAEDATGIARLLLERGARVGEGECSPALALTRLVVGGASAGELKDALARAGAGAGGQRLSNGFTPYLWAAALAPGYGHVRAFLDNGVDAGQALPSHPSTDAAHGDGALAIAAMCNPSVDVIRGLSQVLDMDEHFDFRQDRTPLMLACERNPSLAVAERLVELGAGVEAADTSLNTPFLLAARRPGSARLLRMLAARGADTAVQNSDEVTALVAAARDNPDPEVIRALLELRVPTEPLAISGDNALTAAARANPSPEVIRLLLGAGIAMVPDLATGERLWLVLPPERVAWLEDNDLLDGLKQRAGVPVAPKAATAAAGAPEERMAARNEAGAGAPSPWDMSRPDALAVCHTPREYGEQTP